MVVLQEDYELLFHLQLTEVLPVVQSKNLYLATLKNALLTASCPLGDLGPLARPHAELVFKPEAELYKLYLPTEEKHVKQHSKQPLATLNHAQLTAVCQDGLNGLLVTSNAVEDYKPEPEIFTKPMPTEEIHALHHSNNNNVILNLALLIVLWLLGPNLANAQPHAVGSEL